MTQYAQVRSASNEEAEMKFTLNGVTYNVRLHDSWDSSLVGGNPLISVEFIGRTFGVYAFSSLLLRFYEIDYGLIDPQTAVLLGNMPGPARFERVPPDVVRCNPSVRVRITKHRTVDLIEKDDMKSGRHVWKLCNDGQTGDVSHAPAWHIEKASVTRLSDYVAKRRIQHT